MSTHPLDTHTVHRSFATASTIAAIKRGGVRRPEDRRHERYPVNLAVKYATAADFVTDYVENLSVGGVFITGAYHLEIGQEVQVAFDLPAHGHWRFAARVVFIIGAEAARRAMRKPGAGMEIVSKPPGFDDALGAYLLRLGRRRTHAVIAAEIPGVGALSDAGYRVLPLVAPADVATALADPRSEVSAVIVPPSFISAYKPFAGDRLFGAATPDDIAGVLATLDRRL